MHCFIKISLLSFLLSISQCLHFTTDASQKPQDVISNWAIIVWGRVPQDDPQPCIWFKLYPWQKYECWLSLVTTWEIRIHSHFVFGIHYIIAYLIGSYFVPKKLCWHFLYLSSIYHNKPLDVTIFFKPKSLKKTVFFLIWYGKKKSLIFFHFHVVYLFDKARTFSGCLILWFSIFTFAENIKW